MNVTQFLVILTICASVTSLITEAVKKVFDKEKYQYSTNVIVLIVAMFVGVTSCLVFYNTNGIKLDVMNFLYMLFMGIANWIGATIGYDKVLQTIKQIGEK